MAEVKVLIEGKHDKAGNKVVIGSSVILVKSNLNIVVDTGTFIDELTIIRNLKKEGLTPEDIDIVVLTHMHLDHVVNTHLFKNSRIYCKLRGFNYPGQFHVPKDGYLERTEINDGIVLTDNVEFLLAPGHTEDMIAVLVKTKEGNIVIAGDSISSEDWADLHKQPETNMVYDLDKYNDSRKKILSIADHIIPGHGKMFKVKK